MAKPIILQLTGEPAAGKTEISKFLVRQHGFTSVAISNLIREYAEPRGIVLKERSDFRRTHLQLIAELGEFAITDAIIALPSDRICVDGIRVPAHAQRLRSFGAKIIALHCPPEQRFKRSLQRKDHLDKPRFEDFLQDEALEARDDNPFVQSTLSIIEMADYHIDSSAPLVEVFQSVEEIVVPLIEQQA